MKEQPTSWRFLIQVCWDHQDDKDALHAFKTEKEARAWVEFQHTSRWDNKTDQFRTKMRKIGKYNVPQSIGFEIADLYRILPSGALKAVDQYQTFADKDGNAIGWISK